MKAGDFYDLESPQARRKRWQKTIERYGDRLKDRDYEAERESLGLDKDDL